jgi:hypothetical protein
MIEPAAEERAAAQRLATVGLRSPAVDAKAWYGGPALDLALIFRPKSSLGQSDLRLMMHLMKPDRLKASDQFW